MRRPGVVLLAAGRGSRLGSLSDNVPKSLLPIGGKSCLERVLTEVVTFFSDVVVVTGYRHEMVEEFIERRFGDSVRCIYNPVWERDTNIVSAQVGVESLIEPSAGYFIVETDVLLDDKAWHSIWQTYVDGQSIWFTKGVYSESLTGGCLSANADGQVTEIVYAPNYTPHLQHWPKLIGVLYVGPEQTEADRQLRAAAIDISTKQYYLQTWIDNRDQLPCVYHDLGDALAVTFNDATAYQAACRQSTATARDGEQ